MKQILSIIFLTITVTVFSLVTVSIENLEADGVSVPSESSFTYSNTYTTTANSYSHCLQKARDHTAFLNAIQ